MVPPAGRTADGAFWLMVAVLTAMPYDSAFAARIWPWTEPGTQVNSRTSPTKRIARRMISIFIVFSLLAISVLVCARRLSGSDGIAGSRPSTCMLALLAADPDPGTSPHSQGLAH